MAQKKLVFDVVFITDDEAVFELRFQKLRESVDYFLVFGTDNSLKKIGKYYPEDYSKIKTFTLEENFSQKSNEADLISTLILDTIKEIYSSFEDLIFFSFSNEIPDLSSLDEMDIKSKEVIFLISDVYEGDFNRKRKYSELGSVLVNFSYLLKNKKNFLHEIFNFKLNMKAQDLGVKNGFKILNFKTNSDDLPDFYVCPFSGRYVEYKFDRNQRKFVFFCEVDKEDVDSDFIFKLKFVKKFPEKNIINLKNKIQNLEIFMPETPLYFTNLLDFQSNYKINSIFRVLSIFDCKDGDDIEIFLEDDSVKKLKYNEIKNPSFREGFRLF